MKLEELQDILFDILCNIDTICRKHSIRYTLSGGTLLGAIRHKGFIPWDDDVDICVIREDWLLLREVLKKELPSHLKLIEPIDLAPNFYDFVPRVVDMRYQWHEETEEDIFYDNKQNHVAVDFFLIDNGADTVKGVRRLAFKQKVLYGLAMGHRYVLKNEKYSFVQKVQTKVLSTIGKRIHIEKIIQWQNDLSIKMNKKSVKYCMITNDQPRYLDLAYEVAWFEENVYVPFRDKELPVPKGYHQKLTLVYGDYMRPPKNRDEYIQHFEEK